MINVSVTAVKLGGVAVLSACLMACSTFALPAQSEPSDNRVSYWMEVAAEHRVDWFERTLETSRPDSVVALAMFEAANAVEQEFPSYLGLPPASSDLPVNEAIDAAAIQALALLYDFGESGRSNLDPDAAALGKSAAEAAFVRGMAVTEHPNAPFRTNAPPGTYIPTETVSAISEFDLSLQPWALPHRESARVAPPPSLASEAYLKDWAEVRDLGGKLSVQRTEAQTETAWFWFFIDMNPILREIAGTSGRTPTQNARMYAMFYMATDDAWIASAEAKAHYQFWRPVTAIRQADRDAQAETDRDAEWTSLISTPPHPEYPCAHCVQAAAQYAVLMAEIGNTERVFSIKSSTLPDAPARLVTLADYVDQTSLSRIYAGAHYRFSNNAGEAAGALVGRFVLDAWPSEN